MIFVKFPELIWTFYIKQKHELFKNQLEEI